MIYMGSKRRVRKEILKAVEPHREPGQTWVEPFVGGGNMIEAVEGPRIGADVNPNVIEALEIIRDQADWLPKNNKEFTEDDYKKVKAGADCWFRSFAGFAYSFGAKWLDSFCKNAKGDDYVARAYRSALKQQPLLQDVKLINCSYDRLVLPPNSLVYCDPPYAGTTKYKGVDDFDSAKFFGWCQQKVKEGHTVFVSEYSAPFTEAWSKTIKTTLISKEKPKDRIEKLFFVADEWNN